MIPRSAEATILKLAASFRAVVLNGPRQSGKTTVLKRLFPGKPYVSLENLSAREFAATDPISFLKQFPQGAILDEVQRVPIILSYLQQILDETKERGLFILSGSNNFLLLESITQSLAGRVGYLDLLPFDFSEINECPLPPQQWNEVLYQGGYPEVAFDKVDPAIWYPSYIRTYIERDVRQVKNVSDLSQFQRFFLACAGRVGQQLNLTNIGNDVGIDYKTVQSWLTILQASYITFLLPPYYKNFNKRITKAPKLYFFDTGLLCNLLGISRPADILNHPSKGQLFENFVINELIKKRYNQGLRSNLYYFRDSSGNELDLLIDKGVTEQIAVEIKAGETLNKDFFKNLAYWNKLTGQSEAWLVYNGAPAGGTAYMNAKLCSWRDLTEMTIS
jgi:uncharacterized protein